MVCNLKIAIRFPCTFNSLLVASVELKCSGSNMTIGFNKTELDENILPYKIHFNHSNCDYANKTSTDKLIDGRLWVSSNFSDCGMLVEESGEDMIFHATVVVEYGSESASKVIYRYFKDTYDLKCILDRNITADLKLDVKDRKSIKVSKSKFLVAQQGVLANFVGERRKKITKFS